jgi:cob(I)alamin adenosyltransferase
MKRGYIQIYTGNGKGKTTAALGIAIRAAGHGLRTGIIQFMKNFPYGELRSLERFADTITIQRFGNDRFVLEKTSPSASDIRQTKNGLNAAVEMMHDASYDIIILDEICVALYFKLVSTEQVLQIMQAKLQQLELILTGRYCPEALIEKADLVTKMIEVKHYYQTGVSARSGIES